MSVSSGTFQSTATNQAVGRGASFQGSHLVSFWFRIYDPRCSYQYLLHQNLHFVGCLCMVQLHRPFHRFHRWWIGSRSETFGWLGVDVAIAWVF